MTTGPVRIIDQIRIEAGQIDPHYPALACDKLARLLARLCDEVERYIVFHDEVAECDSWTDYKARRDEWAKQVEHNRRMAEQA